MSTSRGTPAATWRSVERRLVALVDQGALPGGAAACVADGRVEAAPVGFADLARRRPLGADARFRLASVTKPILAALALALVDDGLLALDDPIARWAPELAAPRVLRSWRGRVDDTVPAERAILVGHLLESTSGWGAPGDLSIPWIGALVHALGSGRSRHALPEPDAWLAALAGLPLLFQPGERWLYDTSYDLLGVVLARAADRPLPALLHERLLAPLGMTATGFSIPEQDVALVVEAVRAGPRGLGRSDADDPVVVPRFASGAGGLASSLDDLVRFAQMLLGAGALDGTRVLSTASVDAMTSDRLTEAQRAVSGPYLAGQSWGHGGSVDVAPTAPWQAVGRYGWSGVSGTSLHVRRAQGTALVVLTGRELHEREDTAVLESLWTAGTLEG